MANQRIDIDVGLKVDKTGLNQIKSSLQEIKNLTAQDLMKIGGHTDIQKAEQELKNLKTSISQIDGALEKAFNTDLGTLNVSKFNQALKGMNLNQVYKDFSAAGAAGQTAFRNVTSQILTTNMQLKQTHNFLNNMATTMANTVKWGVASSIMNNFTGSVQKAYGYVKSLDTSLNDIRIVTGASADEMERFAIKANNAAKELGKSTTDYTEAALIYYQQGLSDEEVEARAETTLKAANVTGQSGQAVSEQLTAVWNGYKVSAEEAELYIDKLAAVAATTASDLEELSTGMSKVASAADLMGVDIDQLNAQMATIVSVTRQAPESVGTALKTIYARMGDIESGLDAETTLGHYTEEMKAMGVNVLDANGKLRDMGSVIEEIGGKWQSMSREQQIALSQTMAGTRQYNNLLSLFDNWDMYTKALETSANAAGTLQKQQDTYMESTQAHLNQLRAASEDLYDSLLDPKGINPLIDGLTTVTNLFANFVDSIGGGSGVLLGLGALGTKVFSQQIATGLATTIKNLQNTKYNAEQVSAQFQILNQFKGLDIKDTTTQKLIKWKEEILQLGSLVTNEQHNEANALMQSTVEIQNQADAWEINKQNAEKYLQVTNLNKGSITGMSKDSQSFDKIDSTLNQRIAEYEKGQKAAQSLQNTINELNNAFYKQTEATGDFARADQEAAKALQEVEKAMDSNLAFMQMREGSLKALASESQEYKNLAKAIKEYKEAVNAPEKEDVTIRDKAQALVNAYQAANNKLKSMAVDTRNTVSREVNGATQEFQASIRNAEAEMEHFKTSLQITGQINSIVKAVSGLGSMAMAFNSLSRIGTIIDDENLSNSEKMLQIMMSLSMAAPILGTNIGKLVQSYGAAKDIIAAKTAVLNASKTATLLATEAEQAKTKAEQLATAASKDSTLIDAAEVAMCEAEALALDAEAAAQTREVATQKLANAEEKKSIGIKLALLAIQNPLVTALGVGIVAAIGASVFAWQHHNKVVKESVETLKESVSGLDSSTSELENLESSLKGVQDQLDELYSKGELSITDKEDIANLERERIELETQLALQKEINEEKQKQTALDAQDALDKGAYDYESKKEQTVMDVKGNQSVINIDSEESRDAWVEGQVARYGERFREQAEQLANSYYEKYHGEITSQMMEDLDTLKSSLDAAKASGMDETAAELQAKIEEIYSFTGMLDDTVLSSMNSVFQGDIAQQNQFHEALQSGDPTAKSGWTDKDLEKAGLAEEQIEALKVAADAAGISLDTLVNTYRELGNEEIIGSFENNINKIKSGVEGEGRTFLSGREAAAGDAINDIKEDYGVDDSFINRALENIEWDKIDYSKFEESFKQAIRNATEDQLKVEAESSSEDKINDASTKYGLDEDVLKTHRDLLLETEEALEGNMEAATDLAIAQKRMQKGQQTLNKNWEEWNDILGDANSTMADCSDILPDVRDAVGDLLNLDTEEMELIPNEWLKDNWDLLEQALNGGEEDLEAFQNAAQAAAGEEILLEVDAFVDKDGSLIPEMEELNNFISTYDLSDAVIGVQLDPAQHARLYSAFNDIVAQSGWTAAQASANFAKMGFDVDLKEVPPKTETTSWSVENPVLDEAATEEAGVPIFKPGGSEKLTGTNTTTFPGALAVESITPNGNFGGSVGTTKMPAKTTGGKKKSGGGGKKGGGGGKGGKKSSEKKISEKKDRYHDVNVKLKQIDKELENIGHDQEKYFGKDLIKALNKELDILEKQKKVYKEKLDIAKQEQKELQNSLKSGGIKFNSDGTISNYEAALQAQENALNKLIDKYNKLPASKQEKFKETVLEPAKEEFEKFKENIERYDELLLDEIPDIEDSLQEIADREIEINVQKLKMEVEIRLDLSEAEKDWNEFQREVIDGIDSDDILGNAQSDKNLYETLLGNGTLEGETNKIKNIMKAINDINTKGSSEIYGDNKQLAMDDLKEAMDEIMGSMTDLNDLKKNIDEAYLDMIDEMGDAFDNQTESLEYVNELLEHNVNLTELLHGEDAYAEMAKHYEDIKANNLEILASQRAAADYYKKMMETETDPEAAEKWKEKWKAVIEETNSTAKESLEILKAEYINSIDLAFSKIQEKFASLAGDKKYNYYTLEWELAKEDDDNYLSALDKTYELQKLNNKYQKSINDTTSTKAQKELNKLRDEELKKLREKDKLTQYDIDRANARYELKLKEIALEEAQQNKSQMRLRRDSSGNYSYQFVADEDSISKAQEDVLDATHSSREMDEAEQRRINDRMIELEEEYKAKLKEIDVNDIEAKKLLEKEYLENMAALQEDYLAVTQNLKESVFMEMALLYDQDISYYQEMSDAEQDILMNQMVPTWDTGMHRMMEAMAGSEGLIPVCEQAFQDLKDATDTYNDSLAATEETAGRTFDSTKTEYTENIALAKDLVEEAKNLVTETQNELTAVNDLKQGVDTLATSYETVYKNATDALTAAQSLWKAEQEHAAEEAKKNNPDPDEGGGKTSTTEGKKDDNEGKTPTSEPGKGDKTLKKGDRVTYESGKYYYTSAGDSPTGTKKRGKKVYVTKIKKGAKYPIHISTGSSLGDGDLGWLKEKQLKFDTGGYTGDWAGNDGKTAILHKKELVLNAKDTENVLATVNIVRDMQSMIDSLNNSILSRTNGFMDSINASLGFDTNFGTDLNQQVSIQASFPNVSSRMEIEQAFENLVNLASQHAFDTRR